MLRGLQAAPARLWISTTRLTVLLVAVGLATSRLGLVGHELVGHGGMVYAVGGRVIGVGLFWFAGGWIRYRVPDYDVSEQVVVALGGIAIEAIVGMVLWLALARRTGLGARIVRAVGAALVIHAAWYLSTGTWHGYGDGTVLRKELVEGARLAVAIGGGVVAVGLAYLGARFIAGALLATLPAARLAVRIGALAAALVVAGVLQAALAVGEVRLRRDATYSVIMQPEEQRIVARELARWQADQARRGVAIDPQARANRTRQLVEEHRDWPFKHVLGALIVLAIVAGVARSPRSEGAAGDRAVDRRLLAHAWLLAIGSIGLVIVLDAVLGV